jgi:dUTP pyrophosphatase
MDKSIIKFIKTREVKTPEYGTPGSAGLDFFIPTNIPVMEFEKGQRLKTDEPAFEIGFTVKNNSSIVKNIVILPHKSILIPSGIKMKIPNGYAGLFVDKSGVSSKAQLTLLAKLIDSDYQGELHINLLNTSDKEVVLTAGDKIAQLILLPVMSAKLEFCSKETDVFASKSVRGEGGFGSTNAPAKKK